LDLREELVKLLREDREFRRRVASALGLPRISLSAELRALREDFEKMYTQFSSRFDESDKKFAALREDFNLRFEEHDKKIEALRQDFDKMYTQFSLRFEEHDKKFNELAIDLRDLSTELRNLRREVGGIGETLGALVEDYTLDRFKEELGERGLRLEEIRSLELEGREIDAVFRDEEIIIVEVKSVVRGDDVSDLAKKREMAEKTFKRPARAIIAGIRVDGAAENLAKQLGIDVLRRFPKQR